MANFTLRQLRYFSTLARVGHFGRAAAACSISQPALSVQIKELEETFGAPLFERAARQVRLTGLGEKLVQQVQSILNEVDELADLARASNGQALGRLRMGIIPTAAPYLLPTLIGKLSGLYPGLDIHVRESLTAKLLQELTQGQLDTAIVALPVSEPSLIEVPLFEENFVFVRPSADEELPVPDGDSLQKMRLLLLEEGHCFRDQALSFCNIQPSSLREGFDGSSLTTLVQMVSAGLGVTLIPEMAIPVETRSASVSIARFNAPQPTRTMGMVWRKTNPLADELIEISNVVRDAAHTLRAKST